MDNLFRIALGDSIIHLFMITFIFFAAIHRLRKQSKEKIKRKIEKHWYS